MYCAAQDNPKKFIHVGADFSKGKVVCRTTDAANNYFDGLTIARLSIVGSQLSGTYQRGTCCSPALFGSQVELDHFGILTPKWPDTLLICFEHCLERESLRSNSNLADITFELSFENICVVSRCFGLPNCVYKGSEMSQKAFHEAIDKLNSGKSIKSVDLTIARRRANCSNQMDLFSILRV